MIVYVGITVLRRKACLSRSFRIQTDEITAAYKRQPRGASGQSVIDRRSVQTHMLSRTTAALIRGLTESSAMDEPTTLQSTASFLQERIGSRSLVFSWTKSVYESIHISAV